MPFDRVIGQETLKSRLMDALQQRRLPHALLFHGPEGTGPVAMAFELAKAVNCRSGPGEPCQQCRACRAIGAMAHPDVRLYVPSSGRASAPVSRTAENAETERSGRIDARTERRQALVEMLAQNPYTPLPLHKGDYLSIEDIRELRREASVKPYEGRRKVVILIEADRMNTPASNALLKTLEEPPGELLLILTTQRVRQLLPTIVSRCQPVHFARLPDEVIRQALVGHFEMDASTAETAVRHADGSLSQALAAASESGVRQRETAYAFLETVYDGTLAALFEQVETLAGSQKDTPDLEEVLNVLLSLFRDVLLMTVAREAADALLQHRDRQDWLTRLADRLTPEQAAEAVAAVEEIKRALTHNAHSQLALTTLALRLRAMTRQAS